MTRIWIALVLALLCTTGGLTVALVCQEANTLNDATPGKAEPSAGMFTAATPSPHTSTDNTPFDTNAQPPSLPPDLPRVVLPRGPRSPNETESDYERRVKLTADFNAFVAASGVSTETQQRLLLALYDFQQAHNAAIDDSLNRRILPETDNPVLDDGFVDRLEDADNALNEALLTTLGWDDFSLWLRYCGGCDSYLINLTKDDTGILRLAKS